MILMLKGLVSKIGGYLLLAGGAVLGVFAVVSKIKRKERNKTVNEVNSKTVDKVIYDLNTSKKVDKNINRLSNDDVRFRLHNKYTRGNSDN